MSWSQFFLIVGLCTITILFCRVIPLFMLKGKKLPEPVEHALNFIPPAAFAALVANDLFKPSQFTQDPQGALMPLIASAIVVAVAFKTRSLIWCIVSGVGTFSILFYAVLR